MVAASGGDNDRTIHKNTAQKEQEGGKQIPISFSSIYQEIHLHMLWYKTADGMGVPLP